jgi:hypothetical protein
VGEGNKKKGDQLKTVDFHIKNDNSLFNYYGARLKLNYHEKQDHTSSL